MAVDHSQTKQIKTITITRVAIPEYSYSGRDTAAFGRAAGTAVAAYAFGVFGAVGGDIARAQMEEPFRKAIRDALDAYQPNFATSLNNAVETAFAARGVKVEWISGLPRLPDDSGYDLANADANTDFLVELYPFVTGFSYGKEVSEPVVDIRWRLFKRYGGGKYIESNRNTVYYDGLVDIGSPGSVRLPVNAEYRFPGHVNALRLQGEKPAIAMRAIASQIGEIVAEKIVPAGKQ